MALKEMRKAATSRTAQIFILLLTLSFVLWGINGAFSGRSARGVAKVGDQWISAFTYQQRYKQTIDQLSHQKGKPLTSDEIASLDVKGHVLDETIDVAALDNMAARLGLATSDATLTRIIQGMSSFQDINGKFSVPAYQQRLAGAGYSPAGFENEMRGEIVRAQLRDALGTGAYLPRGLIEDLILYRAEARQISYLVLDPSTIGTIPQPDDKTLKDYIAKHQAQFMRPELRTFTVVLFRPEDFAARVTVPEDDIKASYNYDIEKYKTPETRSLRAISFPDQASAQAAYEAISSGKKTFEEVGKERGYPASALAFKDSAKTAVDDPKVADAAFALPAPGLTTPINGALAWSLAEVKSITPGSTKPLEAVHDQIKQKLALDQSQQTIDKAVNQFEDGRAGGSTIDELSKSLGLKLVKFTAVDKNDKDASGQTQNAGLPDADAQQLVAAAFASEEGAQNDPDFLKGGGDFVVQVDQVEPAAVKPFDQIADEARAGYAKDELAKRLEAKADELITKYKMAGLGAIATELGKAPVALPSPIRRDQAADPLPAELVDALFDAKQDQLVAGPSAKPDQYLIASVTAIAPPDAKERAEGVEALSPTLDDALNADFVEQFIDAARARLGVRVDKATLDQAASSAR